MKAFYILASIALLSGCTTVSNFKSEPVGYIDKNYQVYAQMVQKMTQSAFASDIESEVTLYINGELVVKGVLPRGQTGELMGSYQSKMVRMSCSRLSIIDTRCSVLMDNRLIGEVRLKYDA